MGDTVKKEGTWMWRCECVPPYNLRFAAMSVCIACKQERPPLPVSEEAAPCDVCDGVGWYYEVSGGREKVYDCDCQGTGGEERKREASPPEPCAACQWREELHRIQGLLLDGRARYLQNCLTPIDEKAFSSSADSVVVEAFDESIQAIDNELGTTGGGVGFQPATHIQHGVDTELTEDEEETTGEEAVHPFKQKDFGKPPYTVKANSREFRKANG